MPTANAHPRRRLLLSLCVLFALPSCFLLAPRLARAKAAQLQPRMPITQQDPSPTPPPSPSPPLQRKSAGLKKLGRRVLDYLTCDPTKNKKRELELSQNGPRFPDKEYDLSDFSVEVLVKGNWLVALEYELEPRATVLVTFKVRHMEPFSQTFSARGGDPLLPNTQTVGGQRIVAFRLPEWFGQKLQPAQMSFRALADGPSGKLPADFQLLAFGIGDRALKTSSTSSVSRPWLQTVGMNARQATGEAHGPGSVYAPGRLSVVERAAVGLKQISVLPPARIQWRQGGEFKYNFESRNTFGMWKAIYRVEVTLRSGAKTTRPVKEERFYQRVEVGLNPQPPPPPPPNYQTWKIKRKEFRPGRYQIGVCGSWGKQEGGESACRLTASGPVYIE